MIDYNTILDRVDLVMSPKRVEVVFSAAFHHHQCATEIMIIQKDTRDD